MVERARKTAFVQARARAYAYTLVTTVVVLVFALGEWWTEKYIADRSRFASTAIELAIVLLATLAFRPIHQRVEGAIEAAFTKRRRQALEALSRLRAELTSFNDVPQLFRRVIEAVDHHGEGGGCAVYVRRDIYRAEASSYEEPAESIGLDDALVIRMRSTSIPAKPRALRSAAPGTIAFPMTVAGELVGFLTVTAKRGDDDPETAAALAALAEAAGLALVALHPQLRTSSIDVPNNLPAGLPPLIGRDEELADIKALLEASRLVTLTGAGGVGKTRTAVHVASEMVRNEDGIWFVDLAPLDEPALVPSAIAEVFDIADEGGTRRLIDRIAAALKPKHLLIVLDNCEHLIDGAAEAVSYLLQTCPRVAVLATSREPLGVAGEEPYRMPSLPVPPEGEAQTAEEALQFGAVALFAARAHSSSRTFELTNENAATVVEIVRRLDGIALAIELAAPRIKVLSVEQLTQRLDERFKLLSGGSRTARPRHQTLRALIGWSYDLLSAAERRFLRRSSIFRGGWTLEAAETVCADPDDAAWNALDLIVALVDKSLIVVVDDDGEQRYRLLESTRQFAAEQLDEAAEREDVAKIHCRYYAEVAERAGQEYWLTDNDVCTARVRRDLENHRAAISWGFARGGEAAAGASIVANLRWLWYTTARREGHALLERAASASLDDAPPLVRGRLGIANAVLDERARSAASAAEAAAAIVREVDACDYVEALTLQGAALGRAGQLRESRAIFETAVPAARAVQVPRLLGWVLSMVAYWVAAYGDRAGARIIFAEAEALLRACNDSWQLARMQLHRAEFLFGEGDVSGALAGVREAGSFFRARRSDLGLCVAVLNEAAYLLALEQLDEAWECAREGLELASRIEHAMAVAWALGHLAELAAETGDVERAALLLGRADDAYRETGSAREPTEQRGYDRALELIRASLPPTRIDALMAEGAAMGPDAAVAEALAILSPRATQNA
jgi:predicted ATPase